MSIKIHWKPNPGPQTEVLTRSENEILYGGARGGGKTDAGIVWMVEPDYIKNPLYRGLVIRRNADDLSDWTARSRNMYLPLKAKFSGNPPIIKFQSGAFIRTGHLKDESAFEKYQGHEYQKMLIEELTQIPNQERYLKLIASCRSTVKDLKPCVFCTANPGGPGHGWVKQRFVDVAKNKAYFYEGRVNNKKIRKSRIFIPARVEDTPQLLENDPEYILFLDSLPKDLRRAWREGDWTVFAGQFFSDFREEVHAVDPFYIPNGWTKIFAVDWGYSPHPHHVGWYVIDDYGNITKYRELQGYETAPSVLAEKIIELSKEDENLEFGVGDTQMWEQNPFYSSTEAKRDEVFTDKSIALQMNDILAKNGLSMSQANKARITGWTTLKIAMKWEGEVIDNYRKIVKPPRYQIFSTCINTIKAYPPQIYSETKAGDMEKQDGDDPCETDRYAIMAICDNLKLPDVKNYFIEREHKSAWQKAAERSGLVFEDKTTGTVKRNRIYE